MSLAKSHTLNGPNDYYQWQITTQAILKTKGVWHAVINDLSNSTDQTEKIADSKAHGIISMTLGPIYLNKSDQHKNAFTLWKTITDELEGRSQSTKFALKNNIFQMRNVQK